MECKTQCQNPKNFFPPHPLCTYPPPLCKPGIQKTTSALSYVWLYLFVVTFPLLWRGSSARSSPASPAPDQVHACLGVLSTQVVSSEPAKWKILYLTRHWFGPYCPEVLAGGLFTAFTTLFQGREWGRREGGTGWEMILLRRMGKYRHEHILYSPTSHG